MECFLSCEEKEELVRSTKKVKSVSHAGFGEGHSSGHVMEDRGIQMRRLEISC